MNEKQIKMLICAVIMTVLGAVFSVANIVLHLSEWDTGSTVATVVFGIFTLLHIHVRNVRTRKNARKKD